MKAFPITVGDTLAMVALDRKAAEFVAEALLEAEQSFGDRAENSPVGDDQEAYLAFSVDARRLAEQVRGFLDDGDDR